MVDANHDVMTAVLLLLLALEGVAVEREDDNNQKFISRGERTRYRGEQTKNKDREEVRQARSTKEETKRWVTRIKARWTRRRARRRASTMAGRDMMARE